LIDTETYVGGTVECLETGVFRSDIPEKFRLDPAAIQDLIDRMDYQLEFAITEEGGLKLSDVTNYEEVKAEITAKLANLRDTPNRLEVPLIYHLDVGAM
jgi:DNA polymerase epsilon subunit 1